MSQDHTAYPNLTRLTLDMVHHNGGTAGRNFAGIADPEADIKRLLDECLGAEGVYDEHLAALDVWLGTLAEDQFMVVTDGEHDEMQALLADAPQMGGETAAAFLENVYEHCI